MEKYVNQLLEDIRAAHQPEESKIEVSQKLPGETEEDYQARQFERHIAEVERFISEDPPHDLSYYCDLTPEQFPPVELLGDAQVTAVIRSFTELLHSWNIGVDIPEIVPQRKAYPLLISLLKEHFFMDTYGFTDWSFCEYDPAGCAFGEHCACRELDGSKDQAAFS